MKQSKLALVNKTTVESKKNKNLTLRKYVTFLPDCNHVVEVMYWTKFDYICWYYKSFKNLISYGPVRGHKTSCKIGFTH
jgi:hypothetical protein